MSPPKCSGDGVHASSSTTTAFILLICLSILPNPITSSSDIGFTSVVISEKGLDFAKDILIQLGVNSLTPLELPEITKSVNIPLIGGVKMSLKDIVITSVNVGESEIEVGESGIVVGATGGNAKLGMDWRYSYSTWLIIPIEVSDQGSATVETKGMEIELKMTMKNQDGNLKLTLLHCVCNMKELFVTLDGGTSWLYQGLIDAFEDQIRTAVEKAITQKIVEGIKSLDSMLQKIPKEVKVDDVVSLNVTFMDDPLFGNSFIEFDIDGLFVSSNFIEANRVPEKLLKDTSSSRVPCQRLEMLGISLDQAVFNTASALYFQAGLMHLTVDNVPDQPLMNTAGWRFIIPKLYKKYPNDDMALNISLTSPPEIIITSEAIATTLYSDLTVDVLDSGVLIPVACISVTISASGVMEISGNNLTGQAKLESFSLDLKWSNVGNFYMSLIEKAIWTFLNNFFIPQVNRHLEKGFPLPIISGFSLENSIISLSDSTISVCSDVNYKEVGSPSTITNFKPKRLDKN